MQINDTAGNWIRWYASTLLASILKWRAIYLGSQDGLNTIGDILLTRIHLTARNGLLCHAGQLQVFQHDIS